MFLCPECAASYPSAGQCSRDGAALGGSDGDPQIGSMVGSYRIVARLGAGGMGTVYKAVHPEIRSRVAIKMLHAHHAGGAEAVKRFFGEARAANSIRHAGIVNVLDTGHVDGRPYLLMEYLEGRSLDTFIEPGLPIEWVVNIVCALLDALGAAHRVGLVHRDIKPHNVFVTEGGGIKLLDFGIAKLRPEAPTTDGDVNQLISMATLSGHFLGTPDYLSPEQAMCQPTDARSDLYSVGVLAFEALTGQKPYSGPDLHELLMAHVVASVPSPRTLRPDIPPGLESVITRALAKSPDHRPRSAAEMATEFREALSPPTAPFPAAPSPPPVAVSPPRASRWWLAPLAGAVVLLPVAVLGIAWAAGAFGKAGPDDEDEPAALPPPPPSPKHFDASAFLPEATRWAKAQQKGAKLAMFATHGVQSDGAINLTATPTNHASYRFMAGQTCTIVTVNNLGTQVIQGDAPVCGGAPSSAPRCTLAQAIERATKNRNDAQPPFIVSYPIGPGWSVGNTAGFAVLIPDDC